MVVRKIAGKQQKSAELTGKEVQQVLQYLRQARCALVRRDTVSTDTIVLTWRYEIQYVPKRWSHMYVCGVITPRGVIDSVQTSDQQTALYWHEEFLRSANLAKHKLGG